MTWQHDDNDLENLFMMFEMTPQEYYYKDRPLGKLLPTKELEEDLSMLCRSEL